jgi:uncharacterized protein with ATP-grasp and redox domains
MSVRLPSIIDETIELNPDYPPLITDSLRRLKAEVLEDRPIRSIAPPAPDWGSWEEQYLRHRGESWLHAGWFFAEHLFYRRIIESVRWWETGRDPFAPAKAREYADSAHRELLPAVSKVFRTSADGEKLAALLLLDLWGNRIDLSYRASTALGATGSDSDDLVVDERERILDRLLSGGNGTKSVHIVTDNVGSELTADLLLADFLTGRGFTVVFHVKMHPAYVGDATASDVLSSIRRFSESDRGEVLRRIGERLDAAFRSGAIRIAPDLFWNSGRFLDALPSRLMHLFRTARLVVFKGDVNYRRLSGDALWSPDAAFAEVVGSFPAPVAVLRTMKSDPVIALPAGLAERLDGDDPRWRTNGKRGIIQYFA